MIQLTKLSYLFFTGIAVLFLSPSISPTTAVAQPQTETKIGTFDSRAIAIAYYRSNEMRKQFKQMKQELADAKRAGNEKRVDQLTQKGPALQKMMHQQGFSTYPVDDILKPHQEKIATIANKSNLSLIVSKWSIVHLRKKTPTVDITLELVKLFDPSEETLKWIEQARKKAPVPIEDVID